MIKKQIWLTSLVTMTMVLQLMAPVLAAQTAVGNEPNGADFKAQLPAVINSSSDGSMGDDFKTTGWQNVKLPISRDYRMPWPTSRGSVKYFV